MNETNEQVNQEILSLDDIYFKDAFTKTENNLNLEVDNANIKCLTSKDNKFSLDSDGNLIVNNLTANSINVQNILDMIYPVGCFYISENNANPSTLFGGVWEQIKDTFLLCAGDKYPAGTTGGESEHILTINEMPKHNHSGTTATINPTDNATYHYPYMRKSWSGGFGSFSVHDEGGSKPHNNMPPYLTVYMFKRIDPPGVLIEYGFISSSRDRANLKTKKYREELSKIICYALIEYFS